MHSRKPKNTYLFDVTSAKDVLRNPILAGEFVKLVPPYELARRVRAESFYDNLLDLDPIVRGILESGNPALELVLAAYGSWRWSSQRHLTTLMNRGPAYKAAIFSNPRIDWYQKCAATAVAKEELLKGIDKTDNDEEVPSEFAKLLAANPRYDRGVIGEVMRGQQPYQDVPLNRRIFIARHALNVEEIPSEDYVGKEMPDSNEMNFHRPLDAFATLAREIYVRGEPDVFRRFASDFLWMLPHKRLGLVAEDWVGKDPAPFDHEKPFDMNAWQDHQSELRYRALEAVYSLLDDITKHLPHEGDAATENEDLATFVVLLILALEREHWTLRNSKQQGERLLALVSNRPWPLRAAAIAVFFEAVQPEDKDGGASRRAFDMLFSEDDYARAFGIVMTDAYHYSSFESGRSPLDSTKYAAAIAKLYDHILQYLFPNDSEDSGQTAPRSRRSAAILEAATSAKSRAGGTGFGLRRFVRW